MNILLLSDTHGEQKRMQAICREHPAMDLYVHLGDIGFDPSLLEGFHIVQGNHDADAWCLRQEEILEIRRASHIADSRASNGDESGNAVERIS